MTKNVSYLWPGFAFFAHLIVSLYKRLFMKFVFDFTLRSILPCTLLIGMSMLYLPTRGQGVWHADNRDGTGTLYLNGHGLPV